MIAAFHSFLVPNISIWLKWTWEKVFNKRYEITFFIFTGCSTWFAVLLVFLDELWAHTETPKTLWSCISILMSFSTLFSKMIMKSSRNCKNCRAFVQIWLQKGCDSNFWKLIRRSKCSFCWERACGRLQVMSCGDIDQNSIWEKSPPPETEGQGGWLGGSPPLPLSSYGPE